VTFHTLEVEVGWCHTKNHLKAHEYFDKNHLKAHEYFEFSRDPENPCIHGNAARNRGKRVELTEKLEF
jgi:hypothetical protein